MADTVEAKWVFLGNPDCDVTESEFKRIQAIVTCVASHCADLLYRPHPRSRKLPESVAAAVSQDRSESMWEIRCLNGGVDDDTVLFGFGSTAQINPVRMFGLKPTLVFLHNFLNDGIDRTCAERCYSEAKALYGEGDKVFAPASMRELESLLRRLSNVEDIKMKRWDDRRVNTSTAILQAAWMEEYQPCRREDPQGVHCPPSSSERGRSCF